jgi:hypothetical protein
MLPLLQDVVSRAAALASACQVKINEIQPPCYELRQNKVLGMYPAARLPFP